MFWGRGFVCSSPFQHKVLHFIQKFKVCWKSVVSCKIINSCNFYIRTLLNQNFLGGGMSPLSPSLSSSPFQLRVLHFIQKFKVCWKVLFFAKNLVAVTLYIRTSLDQKFLRGTCPPCPLPPLPFGSVTLLLKVLRQCAKL